MLAIAGDALARNCGRGDGGRADGLNVELGPGVETGAGAGVAVSKADRMGSKFWPLVLVGGGGGG